MSAFCPNRLLALAARCYLFFCYYAAIAVLLTATARATVATLFLLLLPAAGVDQGRSCSLGGGVESVADHGRGREQGQPRGMCINHYSTLGSRITNNLQWVPGFKNTPWQTETGALNYASLLSAVGIIVLLVWRHIADLINRKSRMGARNSRFLLC